MEQGIGMHVPLGHAHVRAGCTRKYVSAGASYLAPATATARVGSGVHRRYPAVLAWSVLAYRQLAREGPTVWTNPTPPCQQWIIGLRLVLFFLSSGRWLGFLPGLTMS